MKKVPCKICKAKTFVLQCNISQEGMAITNAIIVEKLIFSETQATASDHVCVIF